MIFNDKMARLPRLYLCFKIIGVLFFCFFFFIKGRKLTSFQGEPLAGRMFQFLDELLFISKLRIRTHVSMFEPLLNITMPYLKRFVLNFSLINSCCQCWLIKLFASITILVVAIWGWTQLNKRYHHTGIKPDDFYTTKTRGQHIIIPTNVVLDFGAFIFFYCLFVFFVLFYAFSVCE